MESPKSQITKEQIAQYNKDGIVCLRDVFDLKWIEFLREAAKEAQKNPGPQAEAYTKEGEKGGFFGDLELSLRLPKFKQFAFESPAAKIVQTIMQSEKVNFFYDHLIIKEPGTRERTPWHQDMPYWAVKGNQVCTIWLPLDPIEKSNCVEYVKSSHSWGKTYNPQNFMDGSEYDNANEYTMPDIEANRNDYDIIAFDMQAGDCLVFHGMTIHGAGGNELTTSRRALATRWTGDDARYHIRKWKTAIPTENPGLKDGDILDCERFPKII